MPKHLPSYMPHQMQSMIVRKFGDLHNASERTGVEYSTLRSCLFKTEHQKLRQFRKFAHVFRYKMNELLDIVTENNPRQKAKILKERMIDLRIETYSQIALEIGCTIDTVKRLVEEKHEFTTISNYAAIANLFDIELDQLAKILLRD